ncbi:MAG: hypothetical protein K8E24_012780 [Methanobacterium paludis]|nr:hypothetical protein [Methanobacterium paludis]
MPPVPPRLPGDKKRLIRSPNPPDDGAGAVGAGGSGVLTGNKGGKPRCCIGGKEEKKSGSRGLNSKGFR